MLWNRWRSEERRKCSQ